MPIISGNVVDQNDVPVVGAQIYVYAADGDLADLTDIDLSPVTQPIVSGDAGYWETFVSAEGYYKVDFFWGGRLRRTEGNYLVGRTPIEQAEASASFAESVAGPTYASTALGIAATTSGQHFAVDAGGGLVSIYRNNAGVAVFVRQLATTTALAAASGASLVAYKSPLAGTTATTIEARVRQMELLPGDFDIATDGTGDQSAKLTAMFAASGANMLPARLVGNIRTAAAVSAASNMSVIGSANLHIDHVGNAIGGVGVTRASIQGDIRLLAKQNVARGLSMEQWQYATLDGLRFIGNGGTFQIVSKLWNVAYWNTLRNWEIENAVDCFHVEDCNNLLLDNINWVKFGDTGQRYFIFGTGDVSSLTGRALSCEGVFKNNTLVKPTAGSYAFDLEFQRLEGRSGSTNNKGIDFNGAKNNRVVIPIAAFGMFGGVLANEAGNVVEQEISPGVGIHRMGNGYAVLPTRSTSLSGAPSGSFAYRSDINRVVALTDSERKVVLNAMEEDLSCNGYALRNIAGITGTGNVQLLGATPGAAIADAANAAAAPTKAEFDALVGKFNTLLARARAHGWLAT